jgi:ureidoacrylate peracid hydrolase
MKIKNLKEKLDLKKTALIVVDIQNDFCSEKGLFKKHGADIIKIQKMIPKLTKFIKEARKFHIPIIFIRSFYDKKYCLHKKNTPQEEYICKEGTWGADFYKAKPDRNDLTITKHTNDGFLNTQLDHMLKVRDIKTVILTGVTTNVCVDTTARSAFCRGYNVITLKDCVASEYSDLHNSTLKNIKLHFGDVVESRDIIKIWEEML